MKARISIVMHGATLSSHPVELSDLPRHLLQIAGGGYHEQQTAQAMQWSHIFEDKGRLEIKTKIPGRAIVIEKLFDDEVPSYCTVHDAEHAEPEMLDAALTRLKRLNRVVKADIYVQKRVPLDAPEHQNPGWCEYLVVSQFEGGGQLTLGIIQRKPGAVIESHS